MTKLHEMKDVPNLKGKDKTIKAYKKDYFEHERKLSTKVRLSYVQITDHKRRSIQNDKKAASGINSKITGGS